MKTPNNIKSTITNIFSIALVAGLFAACASVTDANMDNTAADQEIQTVENSDLFGIDHDGETGDIWYGSNGDDMDPIIKRPDTREDIEE